MERRERRVKYSRKLSDMEEESGVGKCSGAGWAEGNGMSTAVQIADGGSEMAKEREDRKMERKRCCLWQKAAQVGEARERKSENKLLVRDWYALCSA